ncbi:hypothetical protein L1S34_13985 [Flavobacterium sp. K77]|uniref:MauE/DoxX family redox-associated membrane protein n=1 Tax=Flavobacterium sp. K77 TaxID=2910676 RepID=UPI001F2BB80C|nr:MauE/DoxX family redox-associated membrane protein [Flavobacterium sp. K77]MCF6142402.1 hypothetical protein [Flavobacterium sp. K77]
MKLNFKLQKVFLEIVCFLYIVLFTYASISKLIDFENFQTQLGQSPLLSAYSTSISFLVIFVELGLVFALSVRVYRIMALCLSVGLMAIFTTYIILILNFSSFIPCSCGGILEKLGWTEHLIFNLFFIVIGSCGVLLHQFEKKRIISIFLIVVSSVLFVVFLFLSSENTMQKQNPFIRRFTPNVASRTLTKNLNNYGFYFAGQFDGKIYLGNTISPLTIIEFDSTLQYKKQYTISLTKDNLPFRAVKTKIMGTHFFLYDGSIPIIYRGLVSDWKATIWVSKKPYFTILQPIDSTLCVFRGQQLGTYENILGTISLNDSLKIKKQKHLLQKQIDGVFDTDGTMTYSEGLNKIVYTYFYRNQFIVADTALQLVHRVKTIDTTTKAKLKVVRIRKSGDSKLAAPPYTVNLRSVAFNQLLFNQSGLRGRYESEKNWSYASIVDVYNITNKTYLFSFYIYHENKMKMSDLLITEKALYAIVGHQIVKYTFGAPILKQLKK